MQIKNKKITIKTEKGPQFVDITDRILSFVVEAGIKNGLVTVFSHHTTAAIKINENEPLLIEDMEKILTEVIPVENGYHHNDFSVRTVHMHKDESRNAHSHCQHLLLPTSETIPLIEGKLQFGPWQRVFLIELDHGRQRQITVQVVGQ